MGEELAKISLLLDKLTLEALKLMQEHIEVKMNLEKTMSEGETHLAKSRYIMGHKSVSSLQLPTEISPECDAVAVVHSDVDAKLFGQKSFDLEVRQKPQSDEDSANYQDPLRWFGILVPRDLHKAQAKYRQALVWVVKSVNAQTKLRETCIKIKQLKAYKAELVKQ